MIIETTRGYVLTNVFIVNGVAVIHTKIIKKKIDLVKSDILAMKKIGYRDAYLTDANFGFEDRDLEIFAFGWKNDFNLTDISTMKSPNYERRQRLIDRWFEIVGDKGHRVKSHDKSEGLDM